MNTMYNGKFTELSEGLYLYEGAVHCAVLVRDGEALIFDACDSLTPRHVAELGASRVAWVLLTQYRAPHTAGAHAFLSAGAQIAAPEAERALLTDPSRYWQDPESRFHTMDYRPYFQTPARPLPISRGVRGGDAIDFHGVSIEVMETPSTTDGGVSYLFTLNGRRYAFTGELILSGGRIPELYSMQIKDTVSCGYHGLFGARYLLMDSVRRLAAGFSGTVIPSFGPCFDDLPETARKLQENIDRFMQNYTSVSAMNYYFPQVFAGSAGKMRPSVPRPLPGYVLPCDEVSFLLISETGHALMFDCFREENVNAALALQREGRVKDIEHLFVTHYHYDHIDGVPLIVEKTGCDVWAVEPLADVLNRPDAYFLPCCSNPKIDARALAPDRPFQWHEFTLTPMFFPGQTLYGDALLVEKPGERLLFVGDSFAPTGLDDYCAGNRNFLREGTGLLLCLDIAERLAPVGLINQHQKHVFEFDAEQIGFMRAAIRSRRALVEALTLQPNCEYALDEWYLRAEPFEQTVTAGERAEVNLYMTNHTPAPCRIEAQPVPPEGWHAEAPQAATIPALTSGWAQEPRDGAVRLSIKTPPDAPKGRTVIPIRITVDGRYLGQARVCILSIV